MDIDFPLLFLVLVSRLNFDVRRWSERGKGGWIGAFHGSPFWRISEHGSMGDTKRFIQGFYSMGEKEEEVLRQSVEMETFNKVDCFLSFSFHVASLSFYIISSQYFPFSRSLSLYPTLAHLLVNSIN